MTPIAYLVVAIAPQSPNNFGIRKSCESLVVTHSYSDRVRMSMSSDDSMIRVLLIMRNSSRYPLTLSDLI